MQTLKLGFSTCPNDTFMFDALVNGHTQRGDYALDVRLEDIKTLNTLARNRALDIAKVSFFTYSYLQADWQLLDAGAALGRGVGPLLVAREPLQPDQLTGKTIAIPGTDTTANLLLHFFLPEPGPTVPMLFHEVMPAVASGQADLGLIIHEGRFTYAQHGLHLVQDLGTHWEVQTGLPIPLGGIVARKSLGEAVIRQFETDLRASIVFARQNPKFSQPYVRAHAQEMDPSVMQAHIDLYVNSFSERLGEEGWAAVERLLVVAEQLKQQVAG